MYSTFYSLIVACELCGGSAEILGKLGQCNRKIIHNLDLKSNQGYKTILTVENNVKSVFQMYCLNYFIVEKKKKTFMEISRNAPLACTPLEGAALQ